MKLPQAIMMILLLLGVKAAFASENCPTQDAVNAANLRAFQTELMVAAVSCNMVPQYNQFVTRYKSDLGNAEAILTQFYTRKYGSREGKTQLTTLFTGLANQVSILNIKRGSYFCGEVASLMSQAVTTAPENILVLADVRAQRLQTPFSGCALQTADSRMIRWLK